MSITIGAHMSIAGGYYRAVEHAHDTGCDCVQLFTKNNNQWRAKPLTDEEVERFQSSLKALRIREPLSHSSYLINLAAPDQELWTKSIEAMVVELQRAGRLGMRYVVVHPGAYTTSSESAGIRRVARALNTIHRQLTSNDAHVLLENTAGQGSCLGWKFEHLARILDGVRDPERVGICIDTCHAFAAGYGWSEAKDFRATLAALRATVGLERIKALHINDSKRELGSRVDRHEHIGEGQIGLDGFRRLVRHAELRRIPMYLETPKGRRDGEDLDVINLRTVRSLCR